MLYLSNIAFYDPKRKHILDFGSSRACGCNHNKISIHAEQNAINYCRKNDKKHKYEIYIWRYGKDGKECLIPQTSNNPRMLTPRECARLQGFPEEYVIPVAKTAAYRQFGNSVALPVIKDITTKIIKYLGKV